MSSTIVTQWSATRHHLPYVTIGITVLCLFSFLVYGWLSPLMQQAMIDVWGMRPQNLSELFSRPVAQWWNISLLTLVTSLFIHSGWPHLLGNLAYLWVFGIKVEQRIGFAGMAMVFIGGGVLANILLALRVPQLETPIIGASGAVSSVVGAYLGLFPGRRIGMFIPLGLYMQFARVPAILVIGSWFTLQLLYTVVGPINGAVAWWTHLAGFAMGLIYAMLFRAMAHIVH